MTHRNILVLGGTGFVGRFVVDRLVAQGRTVCVPTRRRSNGRGLFVLPTVDVVEADVHDPATLAGLVQGRDAIINLVGVLHDGSRVPRGASYGAGFAAAHVELPRRLVETCRQAGVRRLLQVSALNADPAGASAYLRSKGDGERAVRGAAGMQSTIFRPSVVFGEGDSFLNLFAGLAAWLPVLLAGRPQARLQPVWVRDLAGAIADSLDTRETIGHSYEICGPTVYTLRELMQLAARLSGHPRAVVGLPDPLAKLMAFFFEHAPGPTLLSRDNLLSLTVDSVASSQPYRPAPELGMHPAPLEPEAALYLAGLHPRTRYNGFRAYARR